MTQIEHRNNEFISQNVHRLRDNLLQERMVLAIPDTTIRARVVDAQAFPRAEVGRRYKDWGIEDLTPGDLWNPWNRTWQSLVVSQDESGTGACVRLLTVEYWDSLTERFVDKLITAGREFGQTREGDIAKFFGLQPFERSRLRFLDDSNTLYIVRDGQIYKRSLKSEPTNSLYNRKRMQVDNVSSDKANDQLGRLLDESYLIMNELEGIQDKPVARRLKRDGIPCIVEPSIGCPTNCPKYALAESLRKTRFQPVDAVLGPNDCKRFEEAHRIANSRSIEDIVNMYKSRPRSRE